MSDNIDKYELIVHSSYGLDGCQITYTQQKIQVVKLDDYNKLQKEIKNTRSQMSAMRKIINKLAYCSKNSYMNSDIIHLIDQARLVLKLKEME